MAIRKFNVGVKETKNSQVWYFQKTTSLRKNTSSSGQATRLDRRPLLWPRGLNDGKAEGNWDYLDPKDS